MASSVAIFTRGGLRATIRFRSKRSRDHLSTETPECKREVVWSFVGWVNRPSGTHVLELAVPGTPLRCVPG
jgi:hypothetical protein